MSILQKFRMDGKKAIVTGGARGIGRATALAFAEAGADVTVLDIRDTSETEAMIRDLGVKAYGIQCDLTKEDQVNAAFAQAAENMGGIDIAHVNAGIAMCEKAEDMSFQQWRTVMAIDLDAVFLCARAIGRIMIGSGKPGAIVCTGSMSGMVVNTPQEQCAYNAAKAGVIQLTRSLACEWAKHGIRVNSVSPGYVCTDMTPATTDAEWQRIWFSMCPTKRMANTEEIAAAVLYLASDAASYTTGSNLVVDGGYTCY